MGLTGKTFRCTHEYRTAARVTCSPSNAYRTHLLPQRLGFFRAAVAVLVIYATISIFPPFIVPQESMLLCSYSSYKPTRVHTTHTVHTTLTGVHTTHTAHAAHTIPQGSILLILLIQLIQVPQWFVLLILLTQLIQVTTTIIISMIMPRRH